MKFLYSKREFSPLYSTKFANCTRDGEMRDGQANQDI